MLGSGEVIGKLQMSWDELLNHGDEPFDLPFSHVRDIHPSLTLKAAVVHTCDNQNDALCDLMLTERRLQSLVDCELSRETDAGHARFVEYVTSENVSHLNAESIFSWFWTSVRSAIQTVQQLSPTSRGRFKVSSEMIFKTLMSPLPSSAMPLHCVRSTISTTAVISIQSHPSADLAPQQENIVAGPDGVDYVIDGCNKLPIDASDEGVQLRRVILELCPLGHQLRPRALDKLAQAVEARFNQHGSIDDLDMSIQLGRSCGASRFDQQGKPDDLDEAISLYEEALRLCPDGHESHDFSLENLGGALVTRFQEYSDFDDITQAVSLYREALTLQPPGNPGRDTTLHNLALALKTRYYELHEIEDLNEAIDWARESLS
ncbi:hypothetical protein BD769DRAFT_1396197, partial [Suillus cothurnatus]